ncbi:MAG: hypothetical protein AAF768_10870 [Pseudomonadota bacterium]
MKSARLVFACVAVLAACTPKPSATLPVSIDDLAWIGPDADPVDVLTKEPEACLKTASPSIEVGELLFNSPLLLGGQAAKAGLHCGACHRSGRGNPDFVFHGVSGVAGTADVTHGLFGPDRADDMFNPVVIPDLAAPEGRVRVDRNSPGAVEAFLDAQIVEEFDGAVPSKTVIAALAAYVRALDEDACDGMGDKAVSWRDETRRIKAGLTELASRSDMDAQTERALRNAVRSALGRLYGRYASEDHTELRAALLKLSQSIGTGVSPEAAVAQLDLLEPDLQALEATSFYNVQSLREALAAQQ